MKAYDTSFLMDANFLKKNPNFDQIVFAVTEITLQFSKNIY